MSSKYFAVASSIVLALVLGGCAETNVASAPPQHASVASRDGSAITPATLNEYRPAPIPTDDSSQAAVASNGGSLNVRRTNVGIR